MGFVRRWKVGLKKKKVKNADRDAKNLNCVFTTADNFFFLAYRFKNMNTLLLWFPHLEAPHCTSVSAFAFASVFYMRSYSR